MLRRIIVVVMLSALLAGPAWANSGITVTVREGGGSALRAALDAELFRKGYLPGGGQGENLYRLEVTYFRGTVSQTRTGLQIPYAPEPDRRRGGGWYDRQSWLSRAEIHQITAQAWLAVAVYGPNGAMVYATPRTVEGRATTQLSLDFGTGGYDATYQTQKEGVVVRAVEDAVRLALASLPLAVPVPLASAEPSSPMAEAATHPTTATIPAISAPLPPVVVSYRVDPTSGGILVETTDTAVVWYQLWNQNRTKQLRSRQRQIRPGHVYLIAPADEASRLDLGLVAADGRRQPASQTNIALPSKK